MAKYNVFVSWEVSKVVEIEAASEEVAEQIVNDLWDNTPYIDEIEMPDAYVPGTFSVILVEESND